MYSHGRIAGPRHDLRKVLRPLPRPPDGNIIPFKRGNEQILLEGTDLPLWRSKPPLNRGLFSSRIIELPHDSHMIAMRVVIAHPPAEPSS